MSQLNLNVNETISKFAQEPVLVSASESVRQAAVLMSRKKISSVVVMQGDEPIGIVTEWDILSRVVAAGKDPSTTLVREVMSAPLVTVPSETRVGEAVSIMIQNGFRRLVVKDGKKLVGIAALTQVVGHAKESSVPIPMFEPPKGSRCPYCGSILKDREELSHHIDDVHIREEVLHDLHGRW